MLRFSNQILKLIRILLVVVEQPRPTQITNVSMTRRPDSSILATPSSAHKFTKGTNAAQNRCSPRRVRTTAEHACEVETFHRFWNGYSTEAEKCRHHILRVDCGGDSLRLDAEEFRQPKQHWHSGRFLPRPLFALLSLGPKHISVIGSEHHNSIRG